ncbi:MAG: class I SAM-dependent methyltransferase [Nitrospirae bacterium YQR-1]
MDFQFYKVGKTVDLRRYIKYVLPHFVVKLYNDSHDFQIAQKNKYFTDLTVREIYTLLAVLLDVEREVKNPLYLEIGVFKGGTLKFLKEHTRDVNFYGVDFFEDFIPEDGNTHVCETFKTEAVKEYIGNGRVTLIKGDSALVLPELKKSQTYFDMIFIDGNHTYEATRRDFENSLVILKKGGYIAFHNASESLAPDFMYVANDGGPWKVTQEIKRNRDFFFEAEVDRLRIFSYLR